MLYIFLSLLGLCDDMVLCGKKSSVTVSRETIDTTKVLDERAKLWAKKQHDIMLKKKREQEEQRIKDDGKLTQKIASAKEWGGPFESSDDVRTFMEISNRPEKRKSKLSGLSYK